LQFQVDLPCPVPSAKRFHFACRANHNYKLAPSRASSEGRFAIVTKRWARDAMDASAQEANELEADGEAAWSWRPLAGVKSATMPGIAPMTVTKTSRTPGRARRKPLKPIACGNAGCSRWTCGDYTRVLSIFGREAAGAIVHPAFPTPSKQGGSAQGSGVLRREIAQP